jgi:cytochrome oxidase Cu insertion factor (SCO1/SenC/PrrC family)
MWACGLVLLLLAVALVLWNSPELTHPEGAKSEFEKAFPATGDAAPEIEAEDIDGKTFKLSDYRGKVVLLDFWGNW